jgi:hypothetical protein
MTPAGLMRAFDSHVSLMTGLVICLLGHGCANDTRSAQEEAVSHWSVSPEPSVVIGQEGDRRYEFFYIVGAATLSDGYLVVADGGSQELRVFNRDGEFVRAHGGNGDGPGEFRRLTDVRTRGDTILAIDSPFRAAARLQVFHAARGLIWGTTLRPEDESTAVTPSVMLSSRALLALRGGLRAATAPPAGTIIRDTLTLGILMIGPQSQSVAWIGEFPNNSWFSYALPAAASGRRVMARYTLGASLAIGASGDRAWLGDTGTGMIVAIDRDGAVVMRTEFPIPPRPFDEATLEQARNAALEAVPDPDIVGARARIDELYSEELRPATAPRFTRFTAGPDGEMWVECFEEIVSAEHCAVVIDQSGREIARATIPPGLDLRAVDRDRIIGIQLDQDGVEQIAIHRLVRS